MSKVKASEEVLEHIESLYKEYCDKVSALLHEDACRNQLYHVGDILQDHHQIGRVLNVILRPDIYNKSYTIVYQCERLTTKLKPFKSGESTHIYECKVQRKLN